METNDIKTVKSSHGGWLVNGTMAVPNAPGNRHYQAVQPWLALGNSPEPEHSAAEMKEQQRVSLKRHREISLTSMTHTFTDGSVIQTRPEDLSNFNIAISVGIARDWIMADNTVRLTTVAEMQEALNSGIEQGLQFWNDYIRDIRAL